VNPPGLLSPWTAEPLVAALAAAAAVFFLQGFLRLRRRGRTDHASWGRAALFAAGLALLVLPLVSPLDELGDRYLLSAHMLQHVLIADAAPALIVLALRGPLLYFAVPEPALRALGRARRLRGGAAWLLRPGVALAAWALAFGAWHVPAAYDYAAAHQAVHELEHASFLAAGFLVWVLLVDPTRSGRLSPGRRLALAGALLVTGTVLADALLFSPSAIYPAYAGQPDRLLGLTPLRDQQLAGLVMIVEQLLTLGTLAAVVLVPELRARRAVPPGLAAGQPA
jgi:cytochrome c oxidase assembly factor CtaG